MLHPGRDCAVPRAWVGRVYLELDDGRDHGGVDVTDADVRRDRDHLSGKPGNARKLSGKNLLGDC